MTRTIDLVASAIQVKKDSWELARSEKCEDWKKFYRTWRSIETDEDKTRQTERSQIKIPATKQAINGATENLYNLLFGVDQFFHIEPRAYDDIVRAQLQASLLEKYLTYRFQQEMFTFKFLDFIKEACIYGTALGQVSVEELDKEDGNTMTIPAFHPISIFDFFINPSATSIQKAEGVIKRSYWKIQDLKRYQRLKLIDGVEWIEGKSDIDEETRYRFEPDVDARNDFNEIEVLEYWGWLDEETLQRAGYQYDTEDGGAEVFAIVAKGVTLKLGPNPYATQKRPFVVGYYEKVPNQFYGIGITEMAQGPQRALDATVRARMDNRALSNNLVFGMNHRKLTPGQDLKLYPGKIFLVEGDVKEAIQQFKIQDITEHTHLDAAEYGRYIQEASGISKMVGGFAAKDARQSATESSLLMQQGNIGLKVCAEQMEGSAIIEICRWYYQITSQFTQQTDLFPIMGENNKEIMVSMNVTELIGDYLFRAMGTVTAGKRNSIGKLMEFLGQTANPYDMQLVNRGYLLKRIYELLGFDDGDMVFQQKPPEEVMQGAAEGPNIGTPPGIQAEGIEQQGVQ